MSTHLQSHTAEPTDLGIVVIGRNEGDRLRRCLQSIGKHVGPIVYVDSGSSDGSIALARSLGVSIVELDPADPFTAAKARNAGLRHLIGLQPQIQFVQFVDGDCELAADWLAVAKRRLIERADVAVVCGRRRERFKEASIYNRLCDMEWDAPTGEVVACGGDAMMRTAALAEVGGFRSSMIAGEEPELCVRLRSRKWKILRISDEMTLHDAAIFHFSQWWRRSMRAGHAFAEAAWLHRGRRELRRVASVLFWAAMLPIVAVSLAWLTRGMSGAVLPILYLVLLLRVYFAQRKRRDAADASLYASFVVIGKFAELCGVTRFVTSTLLRRRGRIIEYKSKEAMSPAMPNVP